MIMISVVIPVYNEEANVAELHRRVKAALIKFGRPFEIIFIDDGSGDRTFEILKTLSPIKIIKFRGNFKQAAAIDAGISAALGDIVVTLDGDLQNDPDDIGRLATKLDEGYDVVVGWRQDRHDSFGRRLHSRLANWLTGFVTGLKLHDHACALKAYRKELFGGITLYGEMHVFLPVLLASRGAKITELVVKHHERKGGISSHNLLRGIKAISDLFTVRFISTTLRPLLFFASWAIISFFFSFFAVVASIFLRIKGFYFSQTPLPILATLFFLVGFLLIMMGFLAEIMIRIYYDTRAAKPYSIKEIVEK